MNRVNHIIGSEKVKGTFIFYVEENDSTEGKLIYPIIEFQYKNNTYRFKGREGTSYKIQQNVPVLVQSKNPESPLLFTIESFWLYPLFYLILPIIIWAAFSLSYIAKNEVLEINFTYPFIRKKRNTIAQSWDKNK
jgi:hypothetical protein